ncbi:MAG: SLBB domain-containing protein [Terracidiphilus sp.]
MAIKKSEPMNAPSQWPRLGRFHLAMILAMILIAGAMPATSGAQAGGGGGSDQGGGQTACGPDTGKPCPTGSSATGTGTAGEQPNWQNGFTQKQTSNAAGAQAAGKAKGAQTTAPAGARAAANRAVPQPLESVENPNTLSGCPTMPIEEEINPAEEESNPNGASNANQGNPNSEAESNPNGASNANQGNPFSAAGANRARAEAARERNLYYYSNPTGAPRMVGGIPYCDLPSLRDLNQLVPNGFGAAPKRFGSDAFYIGAGNADELPMDLPVGPDYVLGPGDSVMVNMWGGQSARIEQMVDRQGQISLPDAGAIQIAGLSIANAQAVIQAVLNKQFHDEHVELSLGQVRTVRVYVVGDVQQPGAYDLSALSTPLNALFLAGGPTARGSLRILRQYRGGALVKEFDLYDFLLKGLRTDPGHLQPGDTILIPPAGPQVTVRGYVHRPAIFELHGETTLDQMLNLAGGPLVTASLKQIHVERVVAHERRTMLDLQLPSDHAELLKTLSSFQVQDGDDVLISPILPYNKRKVYLEGHVYRPGGYPYKDGMTINDLIHSYQDVLPEPADHAELVRLQAPDYRPETINLNLPDILAGNDSVPLQPFDVVRIYGRYEIDAPMVRIAGQVLRPGQYPMSKGMRVADLVRMAGGFARGAYRKEADLSSYTIENGQRVLVKDSVVQIEDAMQGDKDANVPLEPGDVVGIRQLTGWQDIGASIAVNGEVEFAGTYAVEEGERLSSVLKRAGGFRADAFPEGAVLDRIDVRNLEEKNRDELIQRIESETPATKFNSNEPVQNQQETLQAMRQQQQEAIAALRSHPAEGRLVIRISSDISRWANTPADIVVRTGDRITIPKRPDVVVISGQVYNPGGLFFEPGRDAKWYMERAGGVTDFGDKKHILVMRANGEVVAQSNRLFYGGELNVRMHAGDSIIVPEKVIGGSQLWRNLIATAQVMSSVAITGAAVGAF